MKHIVISAFLMVSLQAHSVVWEENATVTELFKNHSVNGTFVLYDVTSQRYIGHAEERANIRFIPASTFKIANSLIGLSVGAVKSLDEVLPYGGQPQLFKSWEKNMGLREAISLSNIPVYQALARRIGLQRMRENILRLEFGNGVIGNSIDTFWLNGPLEINAIEQARYLAKLAQKTLPFSQSVQQSVKEIILLERGRNWVLYGKTGWVNAPEPGVGWWVGWVEKDNHIYAFALNMDIKNATDASKRVELGKASLRVLGVL